MLFHTPHPERMRQSVADRPITADPFRPAATRFYSPEILAFLSDPPEPVMPEHARFALIERPAEPACKPKVYSAADDLARAIHTRRAGRPIYLLNAALKMADETTARRGVSIWAINVGDDQPGDYLGWAFIGGLQRRELSELLERVEPSAPQHAEAA